MTAAIRQTGMTALRWGSFGIAFDVSQRVLDYGLDHAFQHIGWLTWLAN